MSAKGSGLVRAVNGGGGDSHRKRGGVSAAKAQRLQPRWILQATARSLFGWNGRLAQEDR